jgi:hypothetical protein
MNTDIIMLPDTIRKNGYTYKLYKRGDKALIYAQHAEGSLIAYEVFKIKVLRNKKFFGKVIPDQEVFPGNECFGVWAWSVNPRIKGMEQVIEIFEKLENEIEEEKQEKNG